MPNFGKISRLPVALREQLNSRLLDNEPAKSLCDWLNALPEAQAVCVGRHAGHELGPFTDRNISDWRIGGFAEWQRRRERLAQTKELAGYSVKLAKAGGGAISEGVSAILSGHILEALEAVAALRESSDRSAPAWAETAELIDQATKSLASIRAGDLREKELALEKQKISQREEALVLANRAFEAKFFSGMLSQSLLEKAQEIAKSDWSNEQKISAMRAAYFSDVDALEKSGDVQAPSL